MNSHVGAITLGVRDLERAKRFYRDGLGWPVQVDQGHFVSFRPADGSSALSSTHGRWGGYFADPDGNLWKIVAGAGDQPYAE
jgi:predicted lactoylglutathione lyase